MQKQQAGVAKKACGGHKRDLRDFTLLRRFSNLENLRPNLPAWEKREAVETIMGNKKIFGNGAEPRLEAIEQLNFLLKTDQSVAEARQALGKLHFLNKSRTEDRLNFSMAIGLGIGKKQVRDAEMMLAFMKADRKRQQEDLETSFFYKRFAWIA